MSRVTIRNKETGALWSSSMPELGIWRKDWVGAPSGRPSMPYGYVSQGFFPFRKKHKGRYEVVS